MCAGGKLAPGESCEEALARELLEELGITVAPAALRPLAFASNPSSAARWASHFHLLMPLFTCTEWEGEPRGVEGQQLQWLGPDELELERLPMPPAAYPLLPPVAEARRRHKRGAVAGAAAAQQPGQAAAAAEDEPGSS